MGKRVAVVGGGHSALAALWALKISTDHDIHLFESGPRLGGHPITVTYQGPNGDAAEVDTDLMYMNKATCTNILGFLRECGVPAKQAEVTFGVSRDQGTFEWAGTTLSSIFAQRKNIFNPRMWRLFFDIIRFEAFAADILRDAGESDDSAVGEKQHHEQTPSQENMADYLDREGYSQEFREDYLVPIIAVAWSTPPDKCLTEFPVVDLIRFIYEHPFLPAPLNRPDRLTIAVGSKQYIDAVLKDFDNRRIHLNCKATALEHTETGTVILTVNGQGHEFDHVILAIPGDQALEILRSIATKEETEILGSFKISRTVAVLHSDVSLMPKSRKVWSSYNFLTESAFPPKRVGGIAKASLTCWMNPVQDIPENHFGPVLLSLNPLAMPDPRLAQGIWECSHPQYTAATIEAQHLLPRIQNTRHISYCGAWTRSGLQEDGFSSGVSVALDHLGAKLPFDFVNSTLAALMKPRLTMKDHLLRLVVLIVQIAILLAESGWYRLMIAMDRLIASRRRPRETNLAS